jgi:hypothetical protein
MDLPRPLLLAALCWLVYRVVTMPAAEVRPDAHQPIAGMASGPTVDQLFARFGDSDAIE